MCSAVQEQGAVLVLSEQQVLPVQLKHCLEEVGDPCSPSAMRGEGGEDLVKNFAKGFISFLFFVSSKKNHQQPQMVLSLPLILAKTSLKST